MTKSCSPLKTNKLLTFDLVDFSGIRSCKFYPAANECHGQSCSGSLFDPSNWHCDTVPKIHAWMPHVSVLLKSQETRTPWPGLVRSGKLLFDIEPTPWSCIHFREFRGGLTVSVNFNFNSLQSPYQVVILTVVSLQLFSWTHQHSWGGHVPSTPYSSIGSFSQACFNNISRSHQDTAGLLKYSTNN